MTKILYAFWWARSLSNSGTPGVVGESIGTDQESQKAGRKW